MTRRLEITVSEETWAALNAVRGHEPRASFVKRALESALSPSDLDSLRALDRELGGSKPPAASEPYKLPPSKPSPKPAVSRSRASASRKPPVVSEVPGVQRGTLGWCPHGRCSLSGPLGEPCPEHSNLRFKPRQ